MADQFANDIQDWSLQAIVRESSGDFAKIIHTDHMDNFVQDQELDFGFFDNFPEIFGLSSSNGFNVDELEELYKPFYRVAAPPSHDHLPVKMNLELIQDRQVENSVEVNDQTDLSSGTNCVANEDHGAAYIPKYKRRKNQQKRVVTQVSAEGLASDMWAWRKYGQKPIKGSPFPRSYYRCSSSKGCLARKQVEQSCMDPGTFIITYTAEHNHTQPTRRNSLAGTVRQKFPSPKSPNPKITHAIKQEKIDDSSNSNSPKTLTHDDQMEKIKQEMKEEHGKRSNDDTNEFLVSELIFEGDFFTGLEDFDEFESSELPMNYSTSASQNFPVRSCS